MLVTNVFLYHCAFGSSGTSMLSHTPQVPPSLLEREKQKKKKERKRERETFFHAVIDKLCFLAVGDSSLLQIALRS